VDQRRAVRGYVFGAVVTATCLVADQSGQIARLDATTSADVDNVTVPVALGPRSAQKGGQEIAANVLSRLTLTLRHAVALVRHPVRIVAAVVVQNFIFPHKVSPMHNFWLAILRPTRQAGGWETSRPFTFSPPPGT
jgi:hypothetical protein